MKRFTQMFVLVAVVVIAMVSIPQSSLAQKIGTPLITCTPFGPAFQQPTICSDGASGAYVTIGCFGSSVQRMGSDGSLYPGWPVGGVSVGFDASYTQVVGDNAGGAIVVGFGTVGATVSQVYAQRIGPGGTLLWGTQGIHVCPTNRHQVNAYSVSDGQGGVVIAWMDLRSGDYDIYAQRLNANGEPMWGASGFQVSTFPSTQGVPIPILDGQGGVYITWWDQRNDNGDIYLQHLQLDGQVVSGWPTNGLPVCTASFKQVMPLPLQDANNGSYVVWEDYRAGSDETRSRIYSQRIATNGNVAAGWTSDGNRVCSICTDTPSLDGQHAIASDGFGGLYILWNQITSPAFNPVDTLRLTRITPGGTTASGWPLDGLIIATGHVVLNISALNFAGGAIVSDGAHGALINWSSGSLQYGQQYIYAQKVVSSGQVAPGWPTGGLVVTRSESDFPTMASDNAGGAFIAWQDVTSDDVSGVGGILGARITSAGQVLYNGTPQKPAVVFVHGLCSNDGMWGTDGFRQAFTDAGFTSYTVNYDGSKRVQEDVKALEDVIKTIPGNGPISVVAHSMGGLVTREYIARQHDRNQLSRIKTVVTLGTPHHGSEMARFAHILRSGGWLVFGPEFSFVDKLVCQLSADALRDLTPSSGYLNGLNYRANTDAYDHGFLTSGDHHEEDLRDPTVQYYNIAGTGGLCGPQDLLARQFIWWAENQANDGVVTNRSAHLYQNTKTSNRTDNDMGLPGLNHNSGPQFVVFCADGYVESSALRDIIINAVKGVPLPVVPQPQLLAMKTDNIADLDSELPILTGHVLAGQMEERELVVPVSSSFRVLAVTSGAHLGLRRPDGTLLTAADTTSVSGLRFISDPTDTAEAFIVTNAEGGLWHVVIDATLSNDQNYGAISQITSPFASTIVTSPQVIYPGNSVNVRVYIDSTGVTLPNVTWTCSVMAPDSATSSLTLYDDGAHSDSLANDGIFGNTFSPSGPIGFYDLTAQVTLSNGVTIVTGSNIELAPANDLAILSSEVVLSQNSVRVGESVNIQSTIHNYGPTPVIGAEVEVWDDKTGVRLDSVTVDLPAGGSVSIASPWIVTPPDTHLVRVTVSPFTLSSEMSYTNNSGFRTVIIGQPVNAVPVQPQKFMLELAPPMPNPSTGQTTLRFSLPRESEATLSMFDILGRRIKQWHFAKLTAGPHLVRWDGKADDGRVLPPSVLFYRLDVGNQHLKQKLIHLQ